MATNRLYNPETTYERTLYNKICVFYNYVVLKEEEISWLDFYIWIQENPIKIQRYASNFLVDQMKTLANLKSIDQIINLFQVAFTDWGINIDEKTTTEIKQQRRLIWQPAVKIVRHENLQTKSEQVDNLIPIVPLLLDYCIAQKDNFKEQLIEIDNSSRDKYPEISEATRKELHTLSRKNDKELYNILLNTAAYMSIMIATGSRPSELARTKLKDITWQGDKILIHRTTGKQGNQRGAKKSIWCSVVPNKNLRHCGILHLSRLLVTWNPEPNDYVFAMGFKKRSQQSETSYFTMITRRFTAIIEALFILQNDRGLGDCKKLHIFRSICTRILSKTHSSMEIQDHIGWSNTTMQNHYQDPRGAALNRTTAFTLAGRCSPDDLPDIAWKFFDHTDDTRKWFDRVVELAVAAGLPLLGREPNKQLKSKIDAYRAKLERGEIVIDESPREKSLKRKLREMEEQLQQLKKQKVAVADKLDDTGNGDPQQQMIELLNHLKKQCKRQDFDQLCYKELNKLMQVIEEIAAITGKSFGLVTSSANGKVLIQLLRIAGAKKLNDKAFELSRPQNGNSWLAWATKHKNSHDIMRKISTKTLKMFKESINLV